jgi:serine/threonine-protein kinase
MASLMFKITNEEAVDIRSIRADIPQALVAVVNKALVKDVDQRYQTGIEFANALKAFLKT